MFARGIVDPVDDFGVRHQPKSSQLLELLAGQLAHTRILTCARNCSGRSPLSRASIACPAVPRRPIRGERNGLLK